jgi:8-oxo-dGTP diphosphatase
MTLAVPELDHEDRLYPVRPFIAASTAVVRDGSVLIAARTKPPSQYLYSLPGGMVEIGESLEDAALRELGEEVGVTAQIIGSIGHVNIIEHDSKGDVRRHVVIVTFAARWISGVPTTGPEASDIAWVTPQSLGLMPVTPGLAEMVARAISIEAEAQSRA